VEFSQGTFTANFPLASTPIAYNLSVVPIVPNEVSELRFALIVPLLVISPPINPAPVEILVTVPVFPYPEAPVIALQTAFEVGIVISTEPLAGAVVVIVFPLSLNPFPVFPV